MFKSKQKTHKQPLAMRLTVLTIVAALVIAACGGDSSDSAAPTAQQSLRAGSTTLAPSDSGGQSADPESPGLGSGGIAEPARSQVTTGRDIIFTATMTVSVNDVSPASSQATRIIESLGGFIFGQNTTSDPEPATVLVFKVPPDRFQDALAALGQVGEIRTQNVTADDVTDRIVDLESRITTAVASVERLRVLLEGADAIKTITELENQLLVRETDLEQLRGSLRTVENQVGLATITVTITQAAARPGVSVAPSAYVGFDDQGASCPGSAGVDAVEGEDVTYCLEIVNVGDTALVDIGVKDAVLGLELSDFTVVFGDLTATLEPGQSIVLAAPLTLERTLRSQTRVTATPITDDGATIEGRSVSNNSTITLAASDPGGIPGFSEGLQRSWEVLIDVMKVLILAVGIALPFIWVVAVVWLFARWRRERRAQLAAQQEQARQAARVPVTPGGDAVEPEDDSWDLEDDN